ncbi:3-oxoacyl-ACP reductase [Achromobacter ruhlandii]|uniref:3-oxoacyl-ACP reductase n=1 Tax=Achromobacter ruhlandii TaxID=72557 RepID=UPI003D25BAB8
MDDHPRAFAQKGAGNGRAQAAAGAGDDDELLVQGEGKAGHGGESGGNQAVNRVRKNAVARASEHFGRPVGTVVNNALPAFQFDGDARPHADTLDWARMNAQLEGSVRAALNTTQAVLPSMRDAGGGRIINVGTNLVQNPVVPYHDYTAAKAALLAFTRTLSHELGADGITVNMVSGGLLRATDASAATPAAVFDLIAASTPLREVTTPEQFADAVLFFASPWSRAVTGQNLIVDGGLVKG